MKKEIILLIIVVLVAAALYFGMPYIEKRFKQETTKGILDAAQNALDKTKPGFDEETKKQQETLDKMEKELKDKYGI